MKIAIQGHSTRGKEVIRILESLGGKNEYDQSGSNERFVYFINNIGFIYSITLQMCSNERRIYTLEEFEKEFPFKVGDEVIVSNYGNIKGTIINIVPCGPIFLYHIELKTGSSIYRGAEYLKPYEEMKEERNITLTLDKAKEWYKKGGELKEIALQAFTEKELNLLPRNWEEFCKNYQIKPEETFVDGYSKVISNNWGNRNPITDKNVCPSKKSAEAHLAMIQLEQLRDCWLDGWKPDWQNSNERKHAIRICKDDISIEVLYVTHAFLSFPTYELALEFLECFRNLIEQAGDLI